ncbi:vacuolar protein sorting protein vps66 [Diplodia corticola]|uniref:Vacuolar protein sorting protein vps66 n=1 Tax=Diplodia corticola TaxID=236234 RepID=A0A1J9R3W6_9PEZI|nr:vacuolar protein sorting protein vps66 [Diplodia corticola]OJD36142.1 vacuolar protein sorting protein vps66 [Diplodia corticola]
MEKYSQYRDRGTGVAPFFPVTTESSKLALPLHLFLFACRVPLLFTAAAVYFLLLSWLPVGSLVRKAALWLMLGIPGIWWIDLQIDGVKRGSLAKQDKKRLPHGGTIIASSFTSPLDALYLAAIFDPIFTVSYPSTRLVQRVTCFGAILHALSSPADVPPPNATLVPIAKLIAQNPDASIVVFPECTTTNGRGILPFSPSLLTVPARTKIFPVSLRYTPTDVATPIPGKYLKFLWNLCSKPTHCIRVRIAEAVFNTAGFKLEMPASSTGRDHSPLPNSRISANAFEGTPLGEGISEYAELSPEEKKVLDRVGEDLARLGRVKRLGLGVREKSDFVKAWTKKRR